MHHVAANVGALSIFSISPGPRDALTAAGAPGVEIKGQHMGRRWNGRGKLSSEVFHSTRQFVVMDIFLTRGRPIGPVFSERGSRRGKMTATHHVESDAKGSKS